MGVFGAICSAHQLEIMQGLIVQAEAATVVIDEEILMTNILPTRKQFILICPAM